MIIFSQNVLGAVLVITTPVMTTPHRLWSQQHLLQWFMSGQVSDQAIQLLSMVLSLVSLAVSLKPTWNIRWIMKMQFILGQLKFCIWVFQIHKRLHSEWLPTHQLMVWLTGIFMTTGCKFKNILGFNFFPGHWFIDVLMAKSMEPQKEPWKLKHAQLEMLSHSLMIDVNDTFTSKRFESRQFNPNLSRHN